MMSTHYLSCSIIFGDPAGLTFDPARPVQHVAR